MRRWRLCLSSFSIVPANRCSCGDEHVYDSFQVVSPRNHMVFTPLLTSACVGTLDLRSVAVSVMSLQKRLKDPSNNYLLGSAQNVDPAKKTVHCKDEDGTTFSVEYDKLVIATGSQVKTCLMDNTLPCHPPCFLNALPIILHTSCHTYICHHCIRSCVRLISFTFHGVTMQGSTFGIPGVEQFSHPLRDITDASNIKNNLIANWSKANTPSRYSTGSASTATFLLSSNSTCNQSAWLHKSLCTHAIDPVSFVTFGPLSVWLDPNNSDTCG